MGAVTWLNYSKNQEKRGKYINCRHPPQKKKSSWTHWYFLIELETSNCSEIVCWKWIICMYSYTQWMVQRIALSFEQHMTWVFSQTWFSWCSSYSWLVHKPDHSEQSTEDCTPLLPELLMKWWKNIHIFYTLSLKPLLDQAWTPSSSTQYGMLQTLCESGVSIN